MDDYTTKKEAEKGLMDKFGYVPNDQEKWVVYKNHLIVIHHENRPKIFSIGCNGTYFELEPVMAGLTPF